MRLPDLLSLGTRLALGSGRGARVRLGLMAAGVAMGTALLLGAQGAWAGLDARQERALARTSHFSESNRIPSDVTLWLPTSDAFFDRDLTINVVAPVGDAPVPPGIDRLPRPGEAFVSPALHDVLEEPEGRLLRARVPARVVGTIAPEGLVEPGELIAYLGSAADDLPRHAIPVKRWGIPRTEDVGELDLAVIQTLLFGSAALLVPILVFIWTATRLSATRREERLAAIRLVGGTPRQVRFLAAVETALASTTGAIGGVLLFLLGRQVVPYLLPPGARLFPQDIAPPLGPAVAAVALVPVLSVLVGWLALRKVTRNPMGVVRKGRRGAWIAVPSAISLGLGLALWLGVHRASAWIGDNGEIQAAYVLSAWVLTAAGVLGVSPWVGSRAATGLARLLRGVGPWLGARRLAHDPGTAGRVSAGVVVVVFAASVTLGYLMILGEISGGGWETLREETVSVSLDQTRRTPVSPTTISSVDGVGTAVPIRVLQGHRRRSVEVAILPCSRLGSVVRTTPEACAPGAVMVTDEWVLAGADGGGGLRPGRDLRLRREDGTPVGALHIPLDPRVAEIPGVEYFQGVVADEAAVPRRTLAAGPISKLLVQTDGRPETVERIRERLARGLPFTYWSVSTRAMLAESTSGSGSAVAAAVRIGTTIALAVAAASMLTSTIGAIQERRRPLAALAAVGVPRRALLWSTAIQTMAPLLAGTVLAAGAAVIVVASTAGTETGEVADTVPAIAPTLPFVGFALVVGIVATLLAFPSVARTISPDALHHE